ncbi:MAG: tetrahydromethanopterin S-methyltransferase subunit A [ANME-2 cluster archaeon]|nr:tetrahydromethanopterin S-methyltransferase subunit A [ANME-2 cluster archaeon]MDF1557387.1 tetrahydromethanopterin S-methyltransferase subunit A [ANME-2 cluster archaeon]
MGSTIPNWPPVSGEYLTGDPGLHAAVVTLASELDKEHLIQYSAIAGSMKTENIGIEKVVANIVSNTNIRYLVICGAEVHGHLAGDALMAMHRSGIDNDGRIVGANGAIPYITNIDSDTINIWRSQVEIIDLMNVEDMNKIVQALDGLAPKEEFEGEPLQISFGGGGEIVEEGITVISPELVSLESRIRAIESEVKDLGKVQKIISGLYSGMFQGFVIGFVITFILLLLRRLI